MPTHVFDPPKGRIERLRIDSTALAANLLGDPSTRTVDVYLPPGYDDASTAYPLFVALAGFTGSGLKMHAWQGFGETVLATAVLTAAGVSAPPLVAIHQLLNGAERDEAPPI